jgi:hypothetical protein
VPESSVGQLLRAAKANGTERKRILAAKYAKEKARREREAAFARERYLDNLVGFTNYYCIVKGFVTYL